MQSHLPLCVGENNIKMRKDVCSSLTYLGVKLDEEKNNVRGGGKKHSSPADDSKVQVLVVPTNEELCYRPRDSCTGKIIKYELKFAKICKINH